MMRYNWYTIYRKTINHKIKRGNMKELLIKRINTYSMMHQALRNKGINDTSYYKQMIIALKELKRLT